MALTPAQEAKFWKSTSKLFAKASKKTMRKWLEPGMKIIENVARHNFERKRSISLGKFAPNALSTIRAKRRKHGKKPKRLKGPSSKDLKAARDSGNLARFRNLKRRADETALTNLVSARGVGVDSGKLAKTYRGSKLTRYKRGGAVFGEAIDNLKSKNHRYARTFSRGKKNQPARPLNELKKGRDDKKVLAAIGNRILASFGKKLG